MIGIVLYIKVCHQDFVTSDLHLGIKSFQVITLANRGLDYV